MSTWTDVHNELSPLLSRVEVLMACCVDAPGSGTAVELERTAVFHTVLEEQITHLRSHLEDRYDHDNGGA